MTDLIDKKAIENLAVLDANPDAMLDEAESSLIPLNDFQDDEDAIDRLLRDTGFDKDNALEEIDEKKYEFGSDISLSDEVGGFNKPEIVQIVDTYQPEQIIEDSVVLVDEHEAVAEEETLAWLNKSQNDEDAIDRLLMDAGFDADDIGLINEFDHDADIKEPEITQAVEIDESEQIAEDSAAFFEGVQLVDDKFEQAVEPSLVPLDDLQNEEDAIDRLLLDAGFDSDDEVSDDVDTFSVFGEIKDDFAESNVIQEDDDSKTVQAIADLVDFDGDRQAGLFVNAAENRSDLLDDDEDLAKIDEFAQLDEVGDIFVEQNVDDFSVEPDKQEEQTQQAEPVEIAIQGLREDDFLLPDLDIIADKESPDTWIDLGIEEDTLTGAFNEPDLFSDDGALEDEIEKIGLASVINELPAEIKPKPSSNNNASVIEDAKNAVLSQIDAEPEITAEQYKKQIKDAENKAKKATVFSYVAFGFCVVTFIAAVALAVMAYGAKTEILKLIDLVSTLEQGAGEGALKNPDEDNNVSVEQLNEQSESSFDLGGNNPPEVVDEPLAEAANTEAVSKPEILKSKTEVAKVKVVPDAGTAKPKIEVAKTKAVSKSENLKLKAEAARVEAVSEAGTAKSKIGSAKTKAVSKSENLKLKAEAAKVGALSEAGTAKPKIGAAKTKEVSKSEKLKPKADTAKSAVVLEASEDKAVAASKAATAQKTIAKIETAKKEPVTPTTKALAPSSWTVQLAAYKQEWYAKSQAAGFKQKGVPVKVVPGDVNNTAWYRLRVGGFKNKGEAASYAARIKKTLNLSSVSVTDK